MDFKFFAIWFKKTNSTPEDEDHDEDHDGGSYLEKGGLTRGAMKTAKNNKCIQYLGDTAVMGNDIMPRYLPPIEFDHLNNVHLQLGLPGFTQSLASKDAFGDVSQILYSLFDDHQNPSQEEFLANHHNFLPCVEIEEIRNMDQPQVEENILFINDFIQMLSTQYVRWFSLQLLIN